MRIWGCLLIILSFSAIGCASNEYSRIPIAVDYERVVLRNNIPVETEGAVVLSEETRKRISVQLDRFPTSHDHIKKVVVTDRFTDTTLGMYSRKVIYLRHMEYAAMEQVLWHEIAHALSENLTDDQYDEWDELLQKRLRLSGLSDMQGEKWGEKSMYAGFPSSYSTKDIWEYIAEHVMYHTMNTSHHNHRWPEEADLIRRHSFAAISTSRTGVPAAAPTAP